MRIRRDNAIHNISIPWRLFGGDVGAIL